MNKADMVDVIQGKGGWVTVYKPEMKKKEEKGMSCCSPWGQTVEMLFKDFKDLKDTTIGDGMEVSFKGTVTSIDEKGIRVRVEQVKL